jgi:hypothetical protein
LHRTQEAGFDLTLDHKRKTSSQGFYVHEMTRLALLRSAGEAESAMEGDYAAGVRSWDGPAVLQHRC